MTIALGIRVADERAARADLRAQIARLEPRGAHARAGGGPRLLSLGELEAVRDALAVASKGESSTLGVADPPFDADGARRLLERVIADPARHRFVRIPLAALGEPGCGAYHVRPRLGLLGMLAGWWEVKLSSGCP